MVSDYDITLVPGTAKPVGAVATVLRPDGTPLVGGKLLEIQHGGSVSIHDGVAYVAQGRLGREDRTGSDGTFAIPQHEKPWLVFILGDDSYAFADNKALEKSTTIQAKLYARIEAAMPLIGGRPGAESGIGVARHDRRIPTLPVASWLNQKATTTIRRGPLHVFEKCRSCPRDVRIVRRRQG